MHLPCVYFLKIENGSFPSKRGELRCPNKRSTSQIRNLSHDPNQINPNQSPGLHKVWCYQILLNHVWHVHLPHRGKYLINNNLSHVYNVCKNRKKTYDCLPTSVKCRNEKAAQICLQILTLLSYHLIVETFFVYLEKKILIFGKVMVIQEFDEVIPIEKLKKCQYQVIIRHAKLLESNRPSLHYMCQKYTRQKPLVRLNCTETKWNI